MHKRRCPSCLSSEVHRSSRRGFFEAVMLPVFLVRPYRCWCCLRRHYGLVLPVPRPARLPLSLVPRNALSQCAFFIASLLGVPLLVAYPESLIQMIDMLDISSTRPAELQEQSALGLPRLRTHSEGPGPQAAPLVLQAVSENQASEALEQNPPAPGSPGLSRQPAGELRTSGEVSVNGMKAPVQSTVFYGDTIRTEAGANAVITVPMKGTLVVLPQTEISLGKARYGQYFAVLKHGGVSVHSLAGAQRFDVEIGGFLVTPGQTSEGGEEIERAADGSARVRATLGAVGVISLSGPEAVFIQSGQVATISADGRLSAPAPLQQAASGSQPQETESTTGGGGVGGRGTPWILLGAAGGGAAIVAAVAAGGGGGGSVSNPSPSAP